MRTTEMTLVRTAEQGEVTWLGGFAHTIKLSGAETGDALCIVECAARRDHATPWHVHRRDDETFYVLDGEMTFYSGDASVQAGAGTLVHLPRDVPHTFVVESERARFLVIGTPAIEDLFFTAAGSPQPQDGPPDFARLAQIALEHGIEILGPPPQTAGDPTSA
jgi:quercetin dioxygenase-like cupin family protein